MAKLDFIIEECRSLIRDIGNQQASMQGLLGGSGTRKGVSLLIISIPKSASTSLAKTLARAHGVEHITGKLRPWKDEIPPEFRRMAEIHPSVREFKEDAPEHFQRNPGIYHYHIPPTEHNLELFRNYPKIVVLRQPGEIPASYRREIIAGYRELPKVFEGCASEDAYFQRAARTGILADLHRFEQGWLTAPKNQLVVEYRDLVTEPEDTIRKIEIFAEVPSTNTKELLRARFILNPSHLREIVHSDCTIDEWASLNGIKVSDVNKFLLRQMNRLTGERASKQLELAELIILARLFALVNWDENALELYRQGVRRNLFSAAEWAEEIDWMHRVKRPDLVSILPAGPSRGRVK